MHDGPGIRTVVFMKGCPLHCLWCHNPESQSFRPEILLKAGECTGCAQCVTACPRKCHRFEDGRHIFDRNRCTGCGKCAEACFSGALELAGKNMTVSQVLEDVLKDKIFYDNSGGGVTLSGGEPLAHSEFSLALLRELKKHGIHTAIETSGSAPWEIISTLLSFVDLWLWDLKASPDTHQKLVGVPLDGILENLHQLDRTGAQIILRCPLVPGVNDDDSELQRIADLADSLQNIQRIDLEPYHPLGERKSEYLNRSSFFRSDFAQEERKKHWVDFLQNHTSVPIHI